jgi:hypothetical protein
VKRLLLIFGGALLLVFLLLVAALFWRNAVAAKHNRTAFALAEAAARDGDFSRALRIINSRPPGKGDVAAENSWSDLEVRCCVQLGLLNRLDSMFNFRRESVLADEEACLMLARAAMHLNDTNRIDLLAGPWRSRTAPPHLWLNFEADRMMLAADPKGAMSLLRQSEFPGTNDSGRLVRLAMLTATDSFGDAWNLLADAYERNPRNSEVRLYRGQILEKAGRPRFARIEFEAAHFAATNNPIYRDTLAEFYRRQGNQLGALDVWAQDLTAETPGFIWTKALFWNRVLRRAEIPIYSVTNRADAFHAFNRYLHNIPTNQFWDEITFDLIPSKAVIQRRQPEAYWLSVLEALRDARFETALDRLRNNPFGNRVWSPELFATLTRILHFRKRGDLNPPEQDLPPVNSTNSHAFLVQIDTAAHKQRVMGKLYQLPDDLQKILADDDAPALALLAAGWFQAGLDLLKKETWPGTTPPWVPYAIAQAHRIVDGPEAALAFALKQAASPELNLLIAELNLATGKTAAGLEGLAGIAPHDSGFGYRAAWLLSTLHLGQERHTEAAAAVAGQPRLLNSNLGQEILARIAIAKKQTNTATRIYQNIVTNSIEAKAYLARLAYANSNYLLARQLTETLQFELPDVMQFRANLQAIDTAEGAQ